MRIHVALAIAWACFAGLDAQAGKISLERVMFPKALGAAKGTTTPPTQAPLSQEILFEFSGEPKFSGSVAAAIRITVAQQNLQGQPLGMQAFGDFEVDGNLVRFTPRLPTSSLPDGFGPTSEIAVDIGMPGLLPATLYRIDLEIGTPNAISNLKGSKIPLPLTFTTKSAIAGDLLIESLYSNLVGKEVEVEKSKTKPKSGTSGLDPNAFSDPAGLFTNIPKAKRPPFRLRFDGPVDPQATNFEDSRIRLRATRDANGAPLDSVFASEAVLTSNTSSGASVLVFPLSILPFGATLELEVAHAFRSLGGTPISAESGFFSVAKYTVATDPTPGTPILDALFEDFDDAVRQDPSITASEGLALASWDGGNDDVLRAGFGFGGSGALGRFEPPEIVSTIQLDTDFQMFPLGSGATPDAQPGTVVHGGVFHFTRFHLPKGVRLRIRGSNPVVITCSQECLIEGVIDLNGEPGTDDVTFDSAIAPAPGGEAGPGGGRGGAGHPVKLPLGGNLLAMLPPTFGESGFAPGNVGPGGGGGGESGCTLPWPGFLNDPLCAGAAAPGDGSRGSGGGGGSFVRFLPNNGAAGPEPNGVKVSGRRGAVGLGNHKPVLYSPNLQSPGEPAVYQALPGNPTNAVAQLNTNPTFRAAYESGLVYDSPPLMNVANSVFANSIRILRFGDAGPSVFTDSDDGNDFFGPNGELAKLQGGQGGGAGGSRTEGLTIGCKPLIFSTLNLPLTVLDSKGGGGGGGGGAMMIQALGPITIDGSTARIFARGGNGGGGETTGNGDKGGNGGGGAGGCVILQSGTKVALPDPGFFIPIVIDVSPGLGVDAAILGVGAAPGVANADAGTLQVGDSGPGAPGLVQIHAPDTSEVATSKIVAFVNYSAFNIASNAVGIYSPLVDMAKTPSFITPTSFARSTWYDLGAATSEFRPAVPTAAGSLPGPVFGVPGEGPFFQGTDPATGLVETDALGNVLNPYQNDIEVDSPDLLKADFIPKNGAASQRVAVAFQGADEDPDHPGLPDLATATPWLTDVTELNGKRFLRWQIRFELAVGGPATANVPRPQVNFLRIPFRY